jgi:GT2 family glycosyltransferase
MSIRASIIIPTRERPAYLEVALASIAPQARAQAAELLVVDDGGACAAIRAIAERFGADYVPHAGPLGLNAARNSGVRHSSGELVVFVDDDVEVGPGWLEALLEAAAEHPHTQVFTGPIHPRLEGRPPRSCGRERPPITTLELGERDTPTRYAWGANMAIRRGALEDIGPFDSTLEDGGDEQEWQERLLAARPGEVLYVAAAGLDHRRSAADCRLRALALAALSRGAGARRFERAGGRAPSLAAELRTLAGCLGHVLRYRCPAGLVMAAHSAGRVWQALRPGGMTARAEEDFLSGSSGTVGGLDGTRRAILDELTETAQLLSTRRLRLALAARRRPPSRRVLVLGG